MALIKKSRGECGLSALKHPRITNIWSKVIEDSTGSLITRVVVESTGAFEYSADKQGGRIVLAGAGVIANMPEGSIEVNDGLVREIALAQTEPGRAVVEVHAEHPCKFNVEVADGIPYRTIITLDRSYIANLFKDKTIVIDPGHGGEDPGSAGPVNLLEKNVVLLIAEILAEKLEQASARAVLTRTGDKTVAPASRFQLAAQERAGLFLGIHTHSDKNSKVSGASTRYKPASRASAALAVLVQEELLKKLRVADRGVRERPELAVPGDIPGVEVEVVTISNWVEEGLLRSPTFHKKAAEGIFNGVKNYLATFPGIKR
ncbi:MAG: N-acetylmuramoyl-L-alanine amidase LytC precursor [Pelotomaculum sp. PtaB.Bin104]|nr:MAG: N-acetylmuramoyl-L-alanine amidase LytC precursor [Pelotomaculum sp. PtaB.Bin104]